MGGWNFNLLIREVEISTSGMNGVKLANWK